MSSIIITCQFCRKKNRIPSDRIGQRAKCGACGRYISGIGGGSDSCPLCQSSASIGVQLSNGKICIPGILQEIPDSVDSESGIPEAVFESKTITRTRHLLHFLFYSSVAHIKSLHFQFLVIGLPRDIPPRISRTPCSLHLS